MNFGPAPRVQRRKLGIRQQMIRLGNLSQRR
jgi:hypothetical protein